MRHKEKKEFPKVGWCSACNQKLHFEDATNAVKVFGDHWEREHKKKTYAGSRILFEKPKG